MTDARLDSPAFQRNRQPILEVLTPVFSGVSGDILEVGCGSGQHAATFAAAFPGATWWPTDIEPAHRASADAWARHDGAANIKPAMFLDATHDVWPFDVDTEAATKFDAIYAFNVIHISPWAVCEGIINGAARHLAPGAPLILYGPFKRNGTHTAESNAAFDASLQMRDPSWGVRDLEDVVQVAGSAGISLETIHEMPANNLTVILRQAKNTP